MNIKNRVRMSYIFAWLFFIVSFLWLAKVILIGYYPDFSVYYYASKNFLAGANPYVLAQSLLTGYSYPPIVLLLFVPFAFVPFETAGTIWVILNLMFLLLSLLLLSKIFSFSFFSSTYLLLASFVFIYFPVKFTLGMGQMNIFVLLLLIAALWFMKRKQEFSAGVILGISLTVKLFPLFLPFYLILKVRKKPLNFHGNVFVRKNIISITLFQKIFSVKPSQVNENLRMLLGILFVILLALILVLVLIPRELTSQFLFQILPGLAASWKLDYYNQALSGFVGRSFGTEMLGSGMKILLTVIISAITIIAVSRNKRQDFQTIALKFGTFIIASLVINTFSWQHHFVWLIIPFYSTYVYIWKNNLNYRYFVALIVAYFLTAINFEVPQRLPVLLQSHVLMGALILFFVNIRLLFLKERK